MPQILLPRRCWNACMQADCPACETTIGDDQQSQAWLQNCLPEPQALNATGLVVHADTPQAIKTLRKLAPGLTLSPGSADDLAQRLGLRHWVS